MRSNGLECKWIPWTFIVCYAHSQSEVQRTEEPLPIHACICEMKRSHREADPTTNRRGSKTDEGLDRCELFRWFGVTIPRQRGEDHYSHCFNRNVIVHEYVRTNGDVVLVLPQVCKGRYALYCTRLDWVFIRKKPLNILSSTRIIITRWTVESDF